jgi:hypothetical protein
MLNVQMGNVRSIYNDLALTEIRVPNKMNRSTENERFCFGAEGEAGFCSALSFGA